MFKELRVAHLPRPRRSRGGPHDGPAPQLRGVDRRAQLRRRVLEHPGDVPTRTRWESDHKLSEYDYASVMDYGARFNSDIHGLGKYDTAAIRFGYGQLIDLIPDVGLERLERARNDIALYDYTHAAARHGRHEDFGTRRRPWCAVQRVHRHVDDRVPAVHQQRRPDRSTSSPSAPTSSARTCSRGTSTARPGIAAPTSRRSSTTSPSSSELLRVQRLPARPHQLGHRRLPEPAGRSGTSTATRKRSSSSSSSRTT